MDVSQKPDDSAVQSSIELPPAKVDYPDEISLIDLLSFFRRQFKTIGAITFICLLIGAATGLTTSPQTRREILLVLTLVPEVTLDPVRGEGINQIPQDILLTQDQMTEAGNLALSSEFPEVMSSQTQLTPVSASLSSFTDEESDRLRLILTSENPELLEESSQFALEMVQDAADEFVESYLKPEIARLDLLIQRTQRKIARLESQLLTTTALSEVESAVLANALQLSQQSVIAEEISALIDYELQLASLSELQTREASLVNIEVIMESQTQMSSSLLQRLVLSAILGLMLSVFVALIIEQLPHLRAALATSDQ